jgi:CheY-like chemotaxis protein
MAVVLIVEDEEQVRVLAEAIVQELGHETLTAGTAEQALAVIQERPDVDLCSPTSVCSRTWRQA